MLVYVYLTYSWTVPCGVYGPIFLGHWHTCGDRWGFICRSTIPLTLCFSAYNYTVMVIVKTNQPSADVCKLQQAYILCLASGVLFILIGSCWPIAYGWKRRQSRNFTMLGCYSWLLSVLIVSCLAALGLELYEKREALLSSTETTCLLDHDKYQLYQLYIPLVVTSTMGAVVLMFLCSSVCCFCCCSRKIGRIC